MIADLAKQRFNSGILPRFYFFRDSNGNEVDLLIEKGLEIHAVEIKYGKTINQDYFKGLNFWSQLSGRPERHNSVVYGGDTASNRH